MAILLRFVRSRTSWSLEPGVDRQGALRDFCLREGEVGLSVWRVDSAEERDLVLAERTLDRGRVDTIDYIEVDEDLVRGFGVITDAPTSKCIKRAARLHCELHWDQTALLRLARALLDANVSARRASKAELKEILSRISDADVDEAYVPELRKLRG